MISAIVDYPLQNIINVHNFILKDLILIFLFVLTTCFTTIYSYSEKEINWIKKKKNHNALLETIWTLIPCFFVLSFMFPSMALLYIEENIEKISLNTVNIIGNQWYWVYENNTYSHNYKFTSNLFLPNEYNKKYLNFLRLFETNEPLVIPIAIKTAFYITSNDVNHSWSVPGLGIKVDAIPGRINLKEITPTKIGMFSGMCSELCGVEHGFMPISLQIVTIKDWINNLGRNNINLDNFWFIG